MFDLLKKKISSFTDKLKKTIEKKAEEPAKGEKEKEQEIEEQKIEEKLIEEERPLRKVEEEKPFKEEPALEEKILEEESLEEKKEEALVEEKFEEIPEEIESKVVEELPEPEEIPEERKEPKFEEKRRELKARVGIAKKLGAAITRTVTIEESDLKEFLHELELSLLESDVEQETAEAIVGEIRKEFVGQKVKSRGLDEFLKMELKKSLQKIMSVEEIDFFKEVEKKKPFVILFLGPNGAGKTTTIAKTTFLLQKKGKKIVWAAADTFRAASIEQLELHAQKLGVRVIKHKYGSDPAAVAFDAIKAAEASKADVVMIDSAGRQETNKNLLMELKKIDRIAKPDLKIYVGEAFTGQALLQQATEFDKELNLHGFVLTKIDCDVKGGTTISLLYKLKKPIIFIGTGQGYSDLMEFKPEYIIERVIG